ncbi:MAG: hypothetical protein K2F84_01585 [Bacteroidales bacterium]|nr:hypothetical protein [Bacteroidales bacterium]
MRRQNLLTVWMKRVLPMFAMAGAGLMIGCNKPDDPYAEPIDPVKILKFGVNGYEAVQYDTIMKYANDPRIATIIYFVDSTNKNNDYVAFSSDFISDLRNSLQKRLDYTSKATGGGTFIFGRSMASSEDSLWFVQNGWVIHTR